MHAEVFFTPHQVDEMYLRDKTVLVIDVLRASTTIAAALYNGAREIIPVATVESAMKIVGNLAGDVTLLGGERNGKMIEGFHLGNSPLEYKEDRVRGRSIVFSTTNGSQAMVKARFAREMAMLSFVNVSTVAGFVSETDADFVILCAGRNGHFSMEDSVCAGMLMQKLIDQGHRVTYGDAGSAALTLYKSNGRSLLKMLKSSEHGRYLAEIGFGDDLKFCAEVDSLPVLPLLVGNVVKLKKEPELAPASIQS
jgi:2-phosphosulfolactate phosphatase